MVFVIWDPLQSLESEGTVFSHSLHQVMSYYFYTISASETFHTLNQ